MESDERPTTRPAVPELCVDPDDRLLLLQWRDPVGGRVFRDPPGGGIEPGEAPADAARRELAEETGVHVDGIVGPVADVWRDYRWAGRRYVQVEPFFLARVDPSAASASVLEPVERVALLVTSWWSSDRLRTADDIIEPPRTCRRWRPGYWAGPGPADGRAVTAAPPRRRPPPARGGGRPPPSGHRQGPRNGHRTSRRRRARRPAAVRPKPERRRAPAPG